MKINVSDLPVEKNNHSYMIKDSKGTILSKADYFNYKLKDFDSVAYVRFASVYREFKDVNTFMDELKKILDKDNDKGTV